MTKDEVMLELSRFGNEQTKKIFTRHGAREELQHWVKKAYWYMLSEYTVAWLAAESQYGWELALEWIESDEERIASAGWSTLSNLVSLRPDEELDQDKLSTLLDLVARDIHPSQNRVRYTMNGFIIAVGSFVEALTKKANGVAATVGKVSVDVGGTSCKVPMATEYIKKIEDKGTIGRKRIAARC